mmetsp:Transcript_17679/g.50067  ORF Transcript_17679/g.50067 Transcript_17679/m.50067 type:complete len:333 (+) Transcript_17679:1609-2607(+)
MALHGELVPRARQLLEQGGIVGRARAEGGAEGLAVLLGSVGPWDDVVEARVEDDLHAPIHLGTRDRSVVDLRSHAGVDTGLQLLPAEVAVLHGKLPSDQPRDERHGPRSVGLVQTRLLPQQRFEDLRRGTVGARHAAMMRTAGRLPAGVAVPTTSVRRWRCSHAAGISRRSQAAAAALHVTSTVWHVASSSSSDVAAAVMSLVVLMSVGMGVGVSMSMSMSASTIVVGSIDRGIAPSRVIAVADAVCVSTMRLGATVDMDAWLLMLMLLLMQLVMLLLLGVVPAQLLCLDWLPVLRLSLRLRLHLLDYVACPCGWLLLCRRCCCCRCRRRGG